MIFKREWVADLIRTKRARDARPVVHRDGKAMRYKVGGRYAVQPGRFKPHVCHVVVESMEERPTASLRAEGGWELPDDWADDLIVAVMELRLDGVAKWCCAKPTLSPRELAALETVGADKKARKAVADRMGRTPDSVRQIEAAARDKLARRMEGV